MPSVCIKEPLRYSKSLLVVDGEYNGGKSIGITFLVIFLTLMFMKVCIKVQFSSHVISTSKMIGIKR